MSGLKGINTALKKHVLEYLGDSKEIVEQCIGSVGSSQQFTEIFRVSWATESVLAGLGASNVRPSLNSARSIVLRLPMLAAIGQGSIAKAELRRFLELLFWSVYFTDHPIEWAEFCAETNSGFARDQHRPIAYAAHRELSFYVDYARELMQCESSGIVIQSLNLLKQASHELNAAVHPGQLAKAKGRSAPFDDPTPAFLLEFIKIQRAVFSNSCVLLAAYRRVKFDKLSAGTKAQFDWLVGAKTRKAIRAGTFGIP